MVIIKCKSLKLLMYYVTYKEKLFAFLDFLISISETTWLWAFKIDRGSSSYQTATVFIMRRLLLKNLRVLDASFIRKNLSLTFNLMLHFKMMNNSFKCTILFLQDRCIHAYMHTDNLRISDGYFLVRKV